MIFTENLYTSHFYHLRIDPNQGYIESGEWKYEVYGVSVIETEDYNFNVYNH